MVRKRILTVLHKLEVNVVSLSLSLSSADCRPLTRLDQNKLHLNNSLDFYCTFFIYL